MNIAIVNPWFISPNSIGGTERYVKDLASSLYSLGHNVEVFMLSGLSYVENGIKFISLNIFGDGIIADEYMLSEKFGSLDNHETYDLIGKHIDNLIDVEKYDVFQLNSHLFLKCFKNKKRIYTIHSNIKEFLVSNSKKEFDTMISVMKEELTTNIKYIVVSNSYLSYWKRILHNNVYSIPHAINIERLKCSATEKALVKKYNLDLDKIKILLPNRLEPIQKRPKLILKACNKLPPTAKEKYQIVFTGIDVQYEKFVDELKKYAIRNKIDVKFVKFDNINEGYKIADYVIIPSRSESFGYSALESLALNKPTFLSNIPTFREIGQNNKNSIIFTTIKELTSILNSNKKIFGKETNQSICEWLSKYEMKLWANKYLQLMQ